MRNESSKSEGNAKMEKKIGAEQRLIFRAQSRLLPSIPECVASQKDSFTGLVLEKEEIAFLSMLLTFLGVTSPRDPI